MSQKPIKIFKIRVKRKIKQEKDEKEETAIFKIRVKRKIKQEEEEEEKMANRETVKRGKLMTKTMRIRVTKAAKRKMDEGLHKPKRFKQELTFQQVKDRMKMASYPLMPHQVEGVKWMMEREKNSHNNPIKGGLLCDHPGLGKTIQICACMVGNPRKRTLIIVPCSVIGQWKKILLEVFSGHEVKIHRGPKRPKEYHEIARRYRTSSFVITTLGTLTKDISAFLINRYWSRIVFDEIHDIRNGRKNFQAVIQLNSAIKWGLSGTPIQNRLGDLTNIYRFLGVNDEKGIGMKSMRELNKRYMKQRTKEEASKKDPNLVLSEKKEMEYEMDFDTAEEKVIYDKIRKNVASEFSNMANSAHSNSAKMACFFELLLRLRQASLHPQLALNGFSRKYGRDMGTYKGRSTKFDKLVKLIREKRDSNCLVFCNFKEEMDMIGAQLKKSGIGYKKYTGSMNDKQRRECLGSFVNYKTAYNTDMMKRLPYELCDLIQSYAPRVLLMQIKAGSVGLNLQEFTEVIYPLGDWNPSNEIQATSRAHRLGQTETVTVHKLRLHSSDPTYETIDDRILGVQKRKLKIVESCMTGKGGNRLTMGDFRSLLS